LGSLILIFGKILRRWDLSVFFLKSKFWLLFSKLNDDEFKPRILRICTND
jgi:hypothetical protein